MTLHVTINELITTIYKTPSLSIACLKSVGKRSVVSDLFSSSATNGTSSRRISFTSHVGAGSIWLVLLWAALIRLSTSAVTGVHSSSKAVDLHVRRTAKIKDKFFLVLSDSYSSLTALGGGYDTIYKYIKGYTTFTNFGKTVILCWIPGRESRLGSKSCPITSYISS